MIRWAPFLLLIAAACRANSIPREIQWTDERAAEAPPQPLEPLPLPKGYIAPVLEYRVDDRAGIFSDETRRQMQIRLVELFVETGVPVTMLVVPAAAPISIDQLSVHVAERNRIEGALIVLAIEERDMRILLGPKAVESLKDQDVSARVMEAVQPHLAEENYATALTHAVRTLDAAMRE